MTTQINQLTELTSTSDGDLLLIRENATGVDKKMQASNLRAKATTKDDVGLGNVPNLDTTSAVAGNFANVNIDGGTIDGTAVNATNLAYTGTLTGGTGVVNLGSGQVVKDANGRLLVGATSAESILNKTIELHSAGTNFSQPSYNVFSYNAAAGNTGYFEFNRSRGLSVGSNVLVQSGDRLGMVRFSGANGTSYNAAAEIICDVDGVPSATNDMPGRLVFATTADGSGSSTERMRIDSSGNVNLTGGGNLILSNGAGIDFSAHPNAAGMTSELLDDYEEGTWSPVYDTTNGDLANFQMFLPGAVTLGFYTKIGRMVYIQAEMATQNAASISGTGIPIVKNLPFPIRTIPSNNLGNNFFVSAGTGGRWNNFPINGNQLKDTTTIRLAKTNPPGFMSVSDFLAINNNNFNTLSLSFCYMTD